MPWVKRKCPNCKKQFNTWPEYCPWCQKWFGPKYPKVRDNGLGTMTFVIPTTGRRDFLRKTIDSIERQKMPNYDIFLICEPENFDKLPTGPRIRHIDSKKPADSVRYFPYQAGLDKVQTEWLTIMDDDLVIGKGWYAALRTVNLEKADIICPYIRNCNGKIPYNDNVCILMTARSKIFRTIKVGTKAGDDTVWMRAAASDGWKTVNIPVFWHHFGIDPSLGGIGSINVERKRLETR